MSITQERDIIRAMIRLYCRLQHQTDSLCLHCSKLLAYSEERLVKCPFGDEKPACQNCQIHCYKPEKRERVKEVMRFSGPRMTYHHPVMALRHLIHTKKSKNWTVQTNQIKLGVIAIYTILYIFCIKILPTWRWGGLFWIPRAGVEPTT